MSWKIRVFYIFAVVIVLTGIGLILISVYNCGQGYLPDPSIKM